MSLGNDKRAIGYEKPVYNALLTQPLILDLYPGAALGVSLRKLSNNYHGKCITLCRVSDSATRDIGFVNDAIDTASIILFCGLSDGVVTKFYDQTGNGNDQIQTDPALAPFIYIGSTGQIVTFNGRPALGLDGSRYFRSGDMLNIDGNSQVTFAVVKQTTDQGVFYGKSLAAAGDNRWGMGITYADTSTFNSQFDGTGVAANTGGTWSSDQHIYNSVYLVNDKIQLWIDDILINQTTAGVTNCNPSIYNFIMAAYNDATDTGVTFIMSGYYWELIIYNQDESGGLNGINSDINDYYIIY